MGLLRHDFRLYCHSAAVAGSRSPTTGFRCRATRERSAEHRNAGRGGNCVSRSGPRMPRRGGAPARRTVAALSAMSDADFAAVLTAQISDRDAAVWEHLVSEDLIGRTRAALQSLLTAHLAEVRDRRQAWRRVQASLTNPDRLQEARADYSAQRHHDSTLTASLHATIAEANAAQKLVNRAAAGSRARSERDLYRAVVRSLAEGIAEHRLTLGDRPREATADQKLWSLLDTVTVPHGSGHVPLSALLEDTEPPASGSQR